MRRLIGAASTFLLIATASGQGNSSAAIPATAPTQSVSNLPSAQPAITRPGQGTVTWSRGTLFISASGESLRAVLRQVARATGMKVTGGVPDGPVFGSYGPGSAQQVLAALFTGLGVNMMLINGSPTQPKELVLTARTGGPTPPAATQPLSAADDPAEVNLAQPQPRPGRHTSPESFSQPATQDQPGTTAAGPAVPLNDNSNVPAASANGDGQPQSPNGVRTPEQIFEELRKRQAGNTVPQ